ncbi:MAG: RluA family pseudouridine synthase [Planctomycetota bacterium]
MPDPSHPESAESLARARRYFAESVEDLEQAGAERMSWTMSKDASLRLDKYVQGRLKGTSRSQVQKLIEIGAVTVNGKQSKASFKLRGGDVVQVVVPPKPSEDLEPEDIPLDILYEDDGFIAINKQAGVIVHPARSHLHGTMLHALAWHFKHRPGNRVNLESPPQAACERSDAADAPPASALSSIGQQEARPGVIHRLDMNTTGVILFGKQDESHWLLAKQFEDRTNTKAYLAVVHGTPDQLAGAIEQPLGKHPTIREGQAVRHDSTGKYALTLFRVRERYAGYTLVECEIKTGRTHQIRVHLQYIGHPIVGDLLYGGELVGPKEIAAPPIPAGARVNLSYARVKDEGKKLEAVAEQRVARGEAHPDGPLLMGYPALHAAYLQVQHPLTRAPMTFTAPLHEPMRTLVHELRKHPHPESMKGLRNGCYIDLDKAAQ